jgi:hypothetical protein
VVVKQLAREPVQATPTSSERGGIMQHMYPTDITAAEATAGFRQVDIQNPSGAGVGHAPTIGAVVYWIDVSHRVVKMAHPGRPGHYYALQMFGRYSFDPPSRLGRWLLRHADYQETDPVELTRSVSGWLTANRDDRYVVVDPSLERDEQPV